MLIWGFFNGKIVGWMVRLKTFQSPHGHGSVCFTLDGRIEGWMVLLFDGWRDVRQPNEDC